MKMSFEKALEYMENGGAVRPSTWKDDSYMFTDGENFIDDNGDRVFVSYKQAIAEWEPIKQESHCYRLCGVLKSE